MALIRPFPPVLFFLIATSPSLTSVHYRCYIVKVCGLSYPNHTSP